MSPRFIFLIIVWAVLCIGVSSSWADLDRKNEYIVTDTTSNLCWSIIVSDTKFTLDGAKLWVAGLNAEESSYGGYSDWHLPSTPDGTWGYDGGNDRKFGVTVSQLGYLYYVSLGLESRQYQAHYTESELQELSKPFENLQPVSYWFETLSEIQLINLETGWLFNFADGSQYKDTTNMENGYAIAVRSCSPVPEPSSIFLFLTGILGVSRIRLRPRR